MTFRVEPSSLRLYAAELTDQSEAAEETRGYASKWGTFGPHDQGALGFLHGKHGDLMAQLTDTLTKLATVLDTSATNMRGVAETYENTDAKSAAEIDGSYPPAQRPITSAGS
ncbi:hypothetical protein [Actinoplanes palleronii]|uniref:Excreted virulence factor EspC (Type VII ESX diderm) n=1 Tax=Actinoplanes palleronii TaxID=113570 RepID=A0ABQ4B7B3_9ACTN|nr:hypothetical protein [Actinoplanes palleronii]GIE66477.1 hypothetical protein Apa02nite_025850 [Actinoplanes palleronii]